MRGWEETGLRLGEVGEGRREADDRGRRGGRYRERNMDRDTGTKKI